MGGSVEVHVGLGSEAELVVCVASGVQSQTVNSLCLGVKYKRKLQEWTLKASSCSECMLLSERRSGSLSSSLVKMADSLGWFLVMRLRRARISVSCRASTEFTFSMPERSGRRGSYRVRRELWHTFCIHVWGKNLDKKQLCHFGK